MITLANQKSKIVLWEGNLLVCSGELTQPQAPCVQLRFRYALARSGEGEELQQQQPGMTVSCSDSGKEPGNGKKATD